MPIKTSVRYLKKNLQSSSFELPKIVTLEIEKTVSDAGKVDYIHGAALIIISPEGKITRYLNGVEQLPFDVKMALTDASNETVGPTVAKMVEYCFTYDPKGKTYVFMWEKIVGIAMTLMAIAFFIFLYSDPIYNGNRYLKTWN